MTPKQVLLNESKDAKVREALKEISAAVGSTMGPSGRTVLIQSERETANYTSTKDGHTVIKDIYYADPVKNMIAMLMKDAAGKTAFMAGDSTTTTVVMINAIVEAFDKLHPSDPMKVLREIRVIADSIVEELGRRSVKLRRNMIQQLATTSANNDAVLGKLVADVYKKAKRVHVTSSMDFDTHTRIISGITFDRGLLVKRLATDAARTKAMLEEPYILVNDREIEDVSEIQKICQEIQNSEIARNDGHDFEKMRALLIVGNISLAAQETLTANHAAKNFKVCFVTPPSFGERSKEIMEDIAIATGATYISESTGDNFERFTLSDLGTAKRVIVTEDKTEMFLSEEIDKTQLRKRVADLKEAKKLTKSHKEKEHYEERITALDGGIGIIEIGSPTLAETKEIIARVEDAIKAVASAQEHGVLPGGGVSYIDALKAGHGAAWMVMQAMVNSPYKTVMQNDGTDPDKWTLEIGNGHAYNIRSGKIEDMLKSGIIDSTKCAQEAVMNAVSVAITILSSQAMIVYDYADV